MALLADDAKDRAEQLVLVTERLAVLVPDIKATESKSTAAAAVVGTGLTALTATEHPAMVAELLIDGNDLP